METKKIKELLKKIRSGKVSVNDAFAKLKHLPYEDLGFAKVDHHRSMRAGFPEVIFCQGKKLYQIAAIYKSLAKENRKVLLTRADEKIYKTIKKISPKSVYNPLARTICLDKSRSRGVGLVAVVCAGTADIPAAEEAAITAEIYGSRVERLYDVGVAGLHRLLDGFDRISQARCMVVLAGMDGVLPSVIGGLAACPVIAVPTSVGYGANFNGIAPLLTMLNSCAPNVSVVNINNGFGAGYIAGMINRSAK
ncbi:MAG: nickel pincer cofactor biosynthesis protein LarB [Candidatus Omnitrophica bacterium]|nr:nickel pincer cofactor biosynthesis protein LarB [Candidatus Omnitrophota bacterium]